MASPAYIPWRSSVNQAMATGNLNPQNYEKAMAAGVSGELEQVYNDTGRNADRALKAHEINNQESNVKAQQKVGEQQSIVSGVGALGSIYTGSKIAGALAPAAAVPAYVGTGAGMSSGAVTAATLSTSSGTVTSGVGASAGAAEAATATGAAAAETGIWSTIGSYIGEAIASIAAFF